MIQRFQDIDKLKLILLNDNQRKLFECIPKPKVFPKNTRKSEHFSIEMVQKKKTSMRNLKESIKDFSTKNFEENDEITKKILNIIDPQKIKYDPFVGIFEIFL